MSRPSDRFQKPENNPSVSELLPLVRMMETKEWFWKSSLFPVSLTMVAVILMYYALDQNPPWYQIYGLIVACYLAVESVHIIYKLCGIRKPGWWLFILALSIFVAGRYVATHCTLYGSYLAFTERLTPPGIQPLGSFFDRWASSFFSAAIPEELFKISPVLIAFAIGRFFKSPWRERLGVWEPLDGVLLGSTCAMGFSAAETVYIYLFRCGSTLPGSVSTFTSPLLALMTFPRGLSEVAGHAAYTGFLGYSIGLAVVRSRRRWLTVAFGFLIATLAHGLWDATNSYANPSSYVIATLEAITFYAMLAAAILKARQISPSRKWNFATDLLHEQHVSHIISDQPEPHDQPHVSSWKNPPPVVESQGQSQAPASPPPQQTVVRTQIASLDDASRKPVSFTLYVSGKVVVLVEGRRIQAEDIPGLTAQTEDGVVAEVVSSPKRPGSIGLRNCSTTAWKAKLPRTLEEDVAPGKAIMIARGEIFVFGAARGEIL